MIEQFRTIEIDHERGAMKRGRVRVAARDRWLQNTLNNIKFRCTNPKDKRYKDYGGRGIKCFLTLEDLQVIYERDRPDLMRYPSIDRIEVEGHYRLDNCQFLELLDNIKKSKRREYPCQMCGIVSLPRRPKGKMVCESCAKLVRFRDTKYPEYVKVVIRACEAYGLRVEASFSAGSRNNSVNKHILNINGCETRIHYAAVTSRTTSSSAGKKYWRFSVTALSDFHVLVARFKKNFVCYVLAGELNGSPCVYIPIDGPTYSTLYDWPSLRDAWHLLDDRKAAVP